MRALSSVCQSSGDVDCFRDHVSHGHLGFPLRYIGARSLIVYPYVFVAGPNKYDVFPCVNDQRKFQQLALYPIAKYRYITVTYIYTATDQTISFDYDPLLAWWFIVFEYGLLYRAKAMRVLLDDLNIV
jgi:hypothetical protein